MILDDHLKCQTCGKPYELPDWFFGPCEPPGAVVAFAITQSLHLQRYRCPHCGWRWQPKDVTFEYYEIDGEPVIVDGKFVEDEQPDQENP